MVVVARHMEFVVATVKTRKGKFNVASQSQAQPAYNQPPLCGMLHEGARKEPFIVILSNII